MMEERRKWIKILSQLWATNLRVSHYYRRAIEAIVDPVLRKLFIKLASKRAQFAYELNQQIKKLGGELFSPQEMNTSSSISIALDGENRNVILKKSMNTEKEDISRYSTALSSINEGGLREILIRHRASITAGIKDLKSLQSWTNIQSADRNIQTN